MSTPAESSVGHAAVPWRIEMHDLYTTYILVGPKIIARVHGEDVGQEAALARLFVAAPRMADYIRLHVERDPEARAILEEAGVL